MIEKHDFALSVCYHCKQQFKDKDFVISLMLRQFRQYNMTFDHIFIHDAGIEVPMEVNFHRKCFTEVAGQEYSLSGL